MNIFTRKARRHTKLIGRIILVAYLILIVFSAMTYRREKVIGLVRRSTHRTYASIGIFQDRLLTLIASGEPFVRAQLQVRRWIDRDVVHIGTPDLKHQVKVNESAEQTSIVRLYR